MRKQLQIFIRDRLKNLQIIVHVLLIHVFIVSHTEIFILKLLKILAFEIYDTSEIAQSTFGA